MKKVSAGICAHNEENTINKLIDQIINEEIELKEIIVVGGGSDSTTELLKRKSDEEDVVRFIHEKERKGQYHAQNRILSEAEGDLILMIDGDGLLKEGSLETLLDNYEDNAIVHGKEVPVTEESFLGEITDELWKIHHLTCLEKPKFTAQLGILPKNLVEEIPEIVLDDTYIHLEAERQGYNVNYVPEAVKYHHTFTELKYYLAQREKNISGRYQLERLGYKPDNRLKLKLKYFSKRLLRKKTVHVFLAMLFIESIAFLIAQKTRLNSNFPVAWSRP